MAELRGGHRDRPETEALGLGLRGPAASARGGGAGGAAAREHLGFAPVDVERPVPLESVELPPPRLDPPAALGAICRQDPYERVAHSYGKSYRDVVRGFRGGFDHPPTSWPTARRGRGRAVLAWCADAGAAAIPFGGGTSVVGGVEPGVPDGYAGAVTRRPAGAGPRARGGRGLARGAHPGRRAPARRSRTQLRAHGLTLRHFPQSFEFSTLGGWIATRAGGHFATLSRTSTTSWSRCG